MTNNEERMVELQNILDTHYGKKNAVTVTMQEEWNYTATYSLNSGPFVTYEYLINEFKKLG